MKRPFRLSNLFHYSLLALMALSLAMCSKKPAGTTVILTGRASAGPIDNGIISVHALNADGTEGAELGTTTTDAVGNFSLSIPPQTGPVEIKVKGGSYREEAGGATVSLGEGEMHALVAKADTDTAIGVDPLTEVATHRAKSMLAGGGNGDLKSVIPAANDELAAATGLKNITEPADDPQHPEDPHGNKGKKALFLAAISQHASGKGRSSLQEADALGQDFEDGKFDGKNDKKAAISVGSANDSLTPTEFSEIGDDEKTFAGSPDNKGGFKTDDATTVNSAPSTLGAFQIIGVTSSTLSWQTSSGATKYEIQVSTRSDCGSALASLKATALTQSLGSVALVSGTQYYVCVVAEDEAGHSQKASNSPFSLVP